MWFASDFRDEPGGVLLRVACGDVRTGRSCGWMSPAVPASLGSGDGLRRVLLGYCLVAQRAPEKLRPASPFRAVPAGV